MKKIKISGFFVLFFAFGSLAFAQDYNAEDLNLKEEAAIEEQVAPEPEQQIMEQTAPVESEAAQAQQGEAKSEPAAKEKQGELEWVWGDVIAVDAAGMKLTVKYLDYETDAEKEIIFSVDEKTVFENAHDLTQVSLQDSASVDYVIVNEGENIARLVSVEKNAPVAQDAVAAQ